MSRIVVNKSVVSRTSQSRIVLVPGLNNSGPAHWQSWLEALYPQARRIQQEHWHEPDLPRWSEAIRTTLSPHQPALLVAHSFGCLAAIRVAQQAPEAVSGVLLVAPPDPARFRLETPAFARPLTRRAVLVGSENDPWMSIERAGALADALGADFLNLGRAGHINAESGHGPWPVARRLIEGLARPPVRSFREHAARPPAA